MNVEYGREDRPEAIDLRVVAVDLGEDDEENREEDSKCKRGRKRIGGKIDVLESVYIFCCNRRLETFRERSHLRQKWSHGMVERNAVCQRLDVRKWKRHGC